MKLLSLLLAVALVGCHGCALLAAPAPPIPSASIPPGADPCPFACAQLHALGCREGDNLPACVSVCDHAAASRMVVVDAPCLATAHTIEQAQLCGVGCVR